MVPRGALRVLVIVVLAAVYFAAGKLGLSLAFVHANATAVWPPTGIALAAFLFLGPSVWPGIFAGAFLVNLTTAGSALSSLGIATGNTIEGLVAAYLVTRYANGRMAFERLGDVLLFAILAALVSPVISATFGVSSLCLTGYAQWSEFGPIWLTWWLGDAGGALVVAPLLIVWANQPRLEGSRASNLELAALGLAMGLTALVIFGGASPLSSRTSPTTFLAFPALVWAAFRFGPQLATVAIAILAGVAIWSTLRGFGPFAGPPPNEGLLLLQSFMGVASVVTLALAAAETELRRADAQKIAERDEFIAVAAHELKTPITSLRLAVQLVRRQIGRGEAMDEEKVRDSLRTVESQSQRLGRLVTELLETVRMREGRMTLDLQQADVGDLVERAVRDAQATTKRHKVALEAPSRLRAKIDPLRFLQVVSNLLDNAIKFSPDGGRIDVDLSSPDHGAVRLAVRDRGIGIAPEDRPRIFERFYQSQQGDQRAGLGLGLYVSREIVELHGGRIEAEFPDDGGTRMVVWLPEQRPAPTG